MPPSGLRAGPVARLLDLDPFATCVDDWVLSKAWNRISDELVLQGANIKKRFTRITTTSASGNGSFGLGSFPPRGVSAGNSPEKDSRYRSQCRASPRVVEINNHRPHQELYCNLFAMSPVSE